MSNDRSPRPLSWMTMGTRGMRVKLLPQPAGCTLCRDGSIRRNRSVAHEGAPAHGRHRDIVLPLGRDEAWEVVSDPEAWLAEHADLELVPGAEGTLDERRAIVEQVDPGERLSFWWGDDGALLTRVELTLDDVRDGTRVTVVESGPVVGPALSSALHRMQMVPA